MTELNVFENGFGDTITDQEVLETLGFFDDWEDRYRYIIDLGKQLPPFPDALKNETHLVRGCQSQVWLVSRFDPATGSMELAVDSDALIVRGLAAIVLAALNHRAPADLLAYDMDGYFARLDLLKHLSPTRGNGLRSMVNRIRETAAALEA